MVVNRLPDLQELGELVASGRRFHLQGVGVVVASGFDLLDGLTTLRARLIVNGKPGQHIILTINYDTQQVSVDPNFTGSRECDQNLTITTHTVPSLTMLGKAFETRQWVPVSRKGAVCVVRPMQVRRAGAQWYLVGTDQDGREFGGIVRHKSSWQWDLAEADGLPAAYAAPVPAGIYTLPSLQYWRGTGRPRLFDLLESHEGPPVWLSPMWVTPVQDATRLTAVDPLGNEFTLRRLGNDLSNIRVEFVE